MTDRRRKANKQRAYPGLHDKLIPILLVLIVAAIILVVAVALAVALGLVPAAG